MQIIYRIVSYRIDYSVVMRTEQHAAVVEQVSEMFEHRSLIDASRPAEITQEPTAGDDHVSRRILRIQTHAPKLRFLVRNKSYEAVQRLGGSVVKWLAHLEWEPGDRGSNPGSRHYSTG